MNPKYILLYERNETQEKPHTIWFYLHDVFVKNHRDSKHRAQEETDYKNLEEFCWEVELFHTLLVTVDT
jgi:hypothetical protein